MLLCPLSRGEVPTVGPGMWSRSKLTAEQRVTTHRSKPPIHKVQNKQTKTLNVVNS